MKQELEKMLVERYPDLCLNYKGDPLKTCFHWGFECQDGWFDLIDSTLFSISLIAKKNNFKVAIDQIKSKFGALVIYLNFENGPSGSKVQQAISQINNIVEQAYISSQTISEISGKPASKKIVNNIVYTITENEAIGLSGLYHSNNS